MMCIFDCGAPIQSYASLVLPGKACFQEDAVLAKGCHTFWDMNIVLLRVVSGKVHCVPENTLCELYGVKF